MNPFIVFGLINLLINSLSPIFFIAGIFLVLGKFNVSKTRVLPIRKSRILGVLALSPSVLVIVKMVLGWAMIFPMEINMALYFLQSIIYIVVVIYGLMSFEKVSEGDNQSEDGRQVSEIGGMEEENTYQQNQSGRTFKKSILGITIILILFFIWIATVTAGGEPGEHVGLAMLVLPFMPAIWIFYPIYFTILALRYSRERDNMDPLDKAMFYILLVGFMFIAFTAYYQYLK